MRIIQLLIQHKIVPGETYSRLQAHTGTDPHKNLDYTQPNLQNNQGPEAEEDSSKELKTREVDCLEQKRERLEVRVERVQRWFVMVDVSL